MNFRLPGATDNTRYHKLRKATNFCSSESGFCDFLGFLVFLSLNALKRSSNEILN